MGLVGKGRQQYPRRAALRLDRPECMPQYARHMFGVQMLLEHSKLAAHPGVAYCDVKRSHYFEHEALEAMAHQGLDQVAAQFRAVVRLDQLQKDFELAAIAG